jgi:tetraacyldisaccharide 4'-kinase
MNEQRARDILSGTRRGLGAALLRAELLLASGPYALCMKVRRWAYRNRLLPSRGAPVPVLCVGNITTGGTGKTPMVAWVVNHLLSLGRRPAVLTRGYKGAGGRSDEADLLRRLVGAGIAGGAAGPFVPPIVVNSDRLAGAKEAVERGADTLVMDDGFQHLRLRRDLDIVLVDATNPFGFGHCLPRGLLREPLSALRDAGAVVVTRSDLISPESLESLRRRLRPLAPKAAVHLAAHKPVRLVGGEGEALPLALLAGRKAFAFCGLGNPEAFFETLRRLGAELTGTRALEDHAAYPPVAIAAIAAEARAAGAEILLTTEKDRVKLAANAFGIPVLALAVEMDIRGGRDALIARIAEALGQGKG